MAAYIDPYGAQEFLVDDVAFRTMVGSDHVRFGYCTQEEDVKILRVKIVFPVRHLISSQEATRMFVTMHQRCMDQRISHLRN